MINTEKIAILKKKKKKYLDVIYELPANYCVKSSVFKAHTLK